MLERDAQARMPKARILLERAADILPGLAGLRQNDKRERARKVGWGGVFRSVQKKRPESPLNWRPVEKIPKKASLGL